MIAIGTQFYPAAGDAERRQQRAREALLSLDAVIPINLQFIDEGFSPEGFRTLPVLRRDSRGVTGAAGVRKPIVSEMFDALAGAARAGGCRYFAYLNADIELMPAAVETILAGDRDAYAFSRVDTDPISGADLGVQIFGLDMFAVDVAWWARERRRFRSYIAGEACWDNVFAALICGHGNAEIVNERPGIRHQRHPALWHAGPFAAHNGFLAALDAPYFSRWVRYVTELDAGRTSGAPLDRRRLLETSLSNPRLSARDTAVHAARQLKARLLHGWDSGFRIQDW
jgi:hypothetical protein